MKSAQSVGRGIHQHAHGRSLGDPARATDRDRTGHADVEGRAAAPGRPLPDRTAIGAGRVRVPRSGRPLPQPRRGLPGPEPGLGGLGVHAAHERDLPGGLAGQGDRRLPARQWPRRPRVLHRADRDTRRGGHVQARPGRRSARGPLRRAGLAADGAIAMRYRLMATYLGVPYHAGLGPDGNEATLFSPGPPPDELGFTPAGGHWRKQVNLTDLGALWQSRLVGEYRGEPCLVLDDLGDRLHIAYQGRDSARARQLGYWEIDREVFEVVVARQDIAGLTEERVEYPPASAMFPPSNRDPAARGRPEAAGRGTAPGGPPPSVTERTGPMRVMPRPGGSGGYADRASSTPDRMAAWHGSPEG